MRYFAPVNRGMSYVGAEGLELGHSPCHPDVSTVQAPRRRSLFENSGAEEGSSRLKQPMVEREDACPEQHGIVVVFDCEADCGFSGTSWREREHHITTVMQPTVICALVIPSNLISSLADPNEIIKASEKRSWWRDEAVRGYTPVHGLLALFDKADVIVGFNCLGFDFPLLKRFYRRAEDGTPPQQRYINHRAKCLDIMIRVRDVSGQYVKLDTLLKENSLPCKTSDGAEAVRMWNENKREELQSYCEADVELTARLALKESILEPGGCLVPSSAYGIRSAVAANCATSHRKKRAREEEDFVIV